MQEQESERRFGGLNRLFGDQAVSNLQKKHVFVAGIGGVGSWAAETLARSGIGQLTLVDLDHVAKSNINRQAHALTSTLGKAKIQAMAERLLDINPHLILNLVDDFIEPDNAQEVLLSANANFILDCTDQIQAKIAMLLFAKKTNTSFLMCGGAGGKIQGLNLQLTDLSQVKQDALLARIRQQLRKHHHYPKGSDAQGKALKKVPKMGVSCLWLNENTRLPWPKTQDASNGLALQGLSCAGYGSSMAVTAPMGIAAANAAILALVNA